MLIIKITKWNYDLKLFNLYQLEQTPQSTITTSSFGLSFSVSKFSILSNKSKFSITLPNTTCLPFKCGVSLNKIKN